MHHNVLFHTDEAGQTAAASVGDIDTVLSPKGRAVWGAAAVQIIDRAGNLTRQESASKYVGVY